MSKISKKTRALAIEALELAASNFNVLVTDLGHVRALLDEDSPEYELAQHAWQDCPGGYPYEFGPPMLAEAALLLRDGWSPGEEVVHLRDERGRLLFTPERISGVGIGIR